MKKLAIFLALGMVFFAAHELCAQASTQQEILGKYPLFFVDYACFKAQESRTYVEVYTQISFADLQFLKHGAQYAASYELEVSIYQQDHELAQRTFVDTVLVSEFERTIRRSELRLSVQSFLLEPGGYSCQVRFVDLETNREASRIVDMRVPTFRDREVCLSDIQFARRIKLVDRDTNAFVKNGRFVEPNVPNVFGYFALGMYIYYEVYGIKPVKNQDENFVIANYRIYDAAGALKKTVQKRIRKPGESSVHSVLLPIDDLSGGKYTFEVTIYDPERKKSASRKKDFMVGWGTDSIYRASFVQLIDQLELIAKPAEIEALRKMDETEKRSGLLAFWQRNDPTPDTPENELMVEFYARVDYANQHFQTADVAGWRTDQGKIYIQFGPPDTIKRFAGGDKNRVSEVWEYAQNNKKFLFEDRSGLGVFEFLDAQQLAGDVENQRQQ